MVYPRHLLLPLGVSFGPLLQNYWLPPEPHLPCTKGGATLRILTRPLILFAAQWSVRPIAPASNHTFSAQCSTKNAPMRWTRYAWGRFSRRCPPPYEHFNCGSPEHVGLREQMPPRLGVTIEPFTRNPLCFLTSQGR